MSRVTFDCTHQDKFWHAAKVGDMLYCLKCREQKTVVKVE